MNIASRAPVALTVGLALAVTGLVTPAAAADVAPGEVVAVDTTAPAVRPTAARMVGIDANLVNGLTVTGAGGSRVSLTARGERPRTARPARASAAVFRGLTAGKVYSVRVNGAPVGTGTALAAVGPAEGLTVSTTSTPDEVLLRWNQRPTHGQGTAINYAVVAKPITALGRSTASAAEVSGVTTDRAATLALDPTIRYTFTVTPRNTASSGRPTSATMTQTLNELHGTSEVPTTPATPTPAPAAPPSPSAPGPGPGPGPSTKTIYVCPDTSTENARGLCTTTQPYTFTTKAYTFHAEATGPAPILDSYETAVAACPGGYNLEDYGWVKYCRKYGASPTTSVKDPTPAGYIDTGTEWSSKDAAPAGYTDNGSAWVTTAAKIPKVVPA